MRNWVDAGFAAAAGWDNDPGANAVAPEAFIHIASLSLSPLCVLRLNHDSGCFSFVNLKQASGPHWSFSIHQMAIRQKESIKAGHQSLFRCRVLGLNLLAVMQSPGFLHFHESVFLA